LGHCPDISLEELRILARGLSQDNRCPGGDMNRVPPEYKSEGFTYRAAFLGEISLVQQPIANDLESSVSL
jgi:hypothetical protein